MQALGKYLKRNMASVSGRKLPQNTYDAVVKLCEDESNTVFIVSGLNDKGLMHVSLEFCASVFCFLFVFSKDKMRVFADT